MNLPEYNISPDQGARKGKKNMDIIWLLLIIGIWVVLQGVILPKLGIST